MTVVSRPVLAGTGGNCQSPSGFTSGNASNLGSAVCTGRTPASWVTQTPWPTGTPTLNPSTTTVKDVFGGLDTTLLKTVLGGGNADAKALIAAAYLNVRDFRIPTTVLTLQQVQHMWTEFILTKGYSPSTGTAHWTAAELIDYLQRINTA
jgi:hypothetical protein